MKPGDTLSHYEIVGSLGKGGMGEVHRARDTRLEREVALKLLPDDFAADPERLARFRREAKVLAALNHTNIAAIHGLEEDGDRIALAMELAEGETLAELGARGPVPVDDALDLAVQIATGLEEAHAKGIVHRDLKPANVKVGPDGQVKILDFGLARAYLGEEDGKSHPDNSPTLTAAMTAQGVILGTAAYMSPEQARGHGVDARTDIWAFGVILWELLAGRRLFAADTVSDTLAMVLRSEPDWEALPADLPPSLRRLLQRCLQRDRRQRLHHIADARIVLEEIRQDGTSAFAPATGELRRRRPAGRAGWAVAAVLAVVAAVLGWRGFDRAAEVPRAPLRLELTTPDGTWLGDNQKCVAITAAGDAVALVLESDDGSALFARDLDADDFRRLPETEDATNPFFSPDGRWIAFTQGRRLRKVSREGGSPVDLCEAEWGAGVWTSDGRLIVTRTYAGGLDVVPADGGRPVPLTEPDIAQGELGHWWPQLLPGEQWLIYTSWSTPIDSTRIMALSLESGEQKLLARGGAFGRWSPSGHLLWVRGGQLLAAPFDRAALRVIGAAEPVLDDIHLDSSDGFSNLDFSADGTLVYAPASVMHAPSELVWYDRDGGITPLDVPARRYVGPRISPDGRRLAVTVTEDGNRDIWIHDLARGTWSRFTFSPSSDFNPQWSPDGRTIYYNGEEPQFTVYARPADGSAPPRLVLKEPFDTVPTCVTPDGGMLMVNFANPNEGNDIWLVPIDAPAEARPLVQTPFSERGGVVSPDGRRFAYVSFESGQAEVYVAAFPDGDGRIQVSIAGGFEPAWSRRGDELYFLSHEGLMAAAVAPDSTGAGDLVIGRPRQLIRNFVGPNWETRDYDPDADGRRFLATYLPEGMRPRTLDVVVNWFTELERVR